VVRESLHCIALLEIKRRKEKKEEKKEERRKKKKKKKNSLWALWSTAKYSHSHADSYTHTQHTALENKKKQSRIRLYQQH
jgi:hypothetical protein